MIFEWTNLKIKKDNKIEEHICAFIFEHKIFMVLGKKKGRNLFPYLPKSEAETPYDSFTSAL